VWNLIERAGAGAWNASTGLDATIYYEIGPKEALPSLLTATYSSISHIDT